MAPPRLELEVGGVRVLLDGEPALLSGTVERYPRRGLTTLPAGIVGRIHERGGDAPFLSAQALVFRSLASADAVRVRGRLGHLEDPSSGYRDQPMLRLQPVGEETAELPLERLLLIAAERRPLARGLGWRHSLCLGVAAMVGFFLLAALVGELAHGLHLGDHFTNLTLRGATPLGRRNLVREVRQLDAWQYPADPRLLELQLQVNQRLGRCKDNYPLLAMRRQFGRITRLARRCPGNPQAVIEAHYALGQFARASQLISARRDELPNSERLLALRARIHLLAGRHAEAAREVRARRVLYQKHLQALTAAERGSAVNARLLLNLDCVASALDELAMGGAAPDPTTCKAISTGLPWTVAAWTRLPRGTTGALQRGVHLPLKSLHRSPELLLLRPIRVGLAGLADLNLRLALLRQIYHRPDGAHWARSSRWPLVLQVVSTLLLLGQQAQARRLLNFIAKRERRWHRAGAGSTSSRSLGLSYQAALELFAGSHTSALEYLRQARHVSAGVKPPGAVKQLERLQRFLRSRREPLWLITHLLRRCSNYEDRRGIWEGVAQGEVEYLTGVVRNDQPDEAAILLLGAPRFRTAPRELVGWVRWGSNITLDRQGACLPCSLADRVRQLARRIIAARALGDTRLLRRLQGTGGRYAAALRRRHIGPLLQQLEDLPALVTNPGEQIFTSPLVSVPQGGYGRPICVPGEDLGRRCKSSNLAGVQCLVSQAPAGGPTTVREQIPRCHDALFSEPIYLACANRCPERGTETETANSKCKIPGSRTRFPVPCSVFHVLYLFALGLATRPGCPPRPPAPRNR